MKELSIQEKAKRYDEAIEIARNINNEHQAQPFDVMTRVFPELKESEDEKIRKDIISFLKEGKPYYCLNSAIRQKWAAWLEKQDEQNPTKVEPKFKVGDEIKTTNEESRIITKIDEKGYWSEDLFICDFDEECLWDLVEHNPAWSEEDERLCKCIIKDQEEALDDVRNDKYGHSEIISDLKDMYRERIDWLKSLKERMKGERVMNDMEVSLWKVEEFLIDNLKELPIGHGKYKIKATCSLEEFIEKLENYMKGE